jgi:hypothetical protein
MVFRGGERCLLAPAFVQHETSLTANRIADTACIQDLGRSSEEDHRMRESQWVSMAYEHVRSRKLERA